MKTKFSILGALTPLLFCFSATAANLKTLPGHVPQMVRHLAAQSVLLDTNQLSLAIGLSLSDPAGLDQFLAEVYDPASPDFRKFLTPEQFTARFGPTESDYELVKNFARTNGLTITGTYGNRLLLDVRGSAAAVERAFHVTLRTYKHPTENRDFFAPDTEPEVNAQLPIADVSGLSDLPRPASNLRHRQPTAVPQVGSGSGGAYLGGDFRAAYVPGTMLDGSGQMVGLVQFDGFYSNDIVSYANAAGQNVVPLQTVLIDGFDGQPTTGSGSGNDEVSLDIEMAMAMAPGLSKIVVFEGDPNNFHPNDVLNMMAASNMVKNLSSSWGWSGGPSTTTENIFKQMAAQGQSYFNASGDSDAFLANMDSSGSTTQPSSSPYITQVGGTTLTTSSGGAYSSEEVWNWGLKNGSYLGSSGGVSSHYPIPSWQAGVSMADNGGSTTMRNIPDVAMVGDNILVYYGNGSTETVGGTSCAAPLWAGFMALVNQQAEASGRAPIGFANPSLYLIGIGSDYANGFHDVTTGNNFWSSSTNKYSATNGFDLCTGWGTPNGNQLINMLVELSDTLGVQPASGLNFNGYPGGPFAPVSQTFSLTNSGNTSLSWSITGLPVWLNVQPTNGVLAIGTSTNVMVDLNSAADNLAMGDYSANLVFSNSATSTARTYFVKLSIISSSILQNGGFETGDFTGWTLVGNGIIGGSVYNAVINADSLSDNTGGEFIHSGTYGAFFGDTSVATLSQAVAMIPGQAYLLSYWLVNPEGGSEQIFYVNWNTDSAGDNQIFSLTNPSVFSWTNETFVLTATSTNTTLQFGAENPPDGFGLDDVSLIPIPAPYISNVKPQGESLNFTWNTLAGVSYQVQYKTNLLQANWTALWTITATNNSLTVTDTNVLDAAGTQRFYRIVTLP